MVQLEEETENVGFMNAIRKESLTN